MGEISLYLTHWGRVPHVWVGNLTIICSDNGLSPGRRQAIIWTNAGILLIWPLGTNFSEILIEIHVFSFKKIFAFENVLCNCSSFEDWTSIDFIYGFPIVKWVAETWLHRSAFNSQSPWNLQVLGPRLVTEGVDWQMKHLQVQVYF